MQMTSIKCKMPVIIAISLVVTLSTEASPRKPTPTLVEVWCGGDDGLTIKLRDALEDAFRSSSAFRLSSGKKPGTLLVTIPSNVEWKQFGSRTQVLYAVEFTSADDAKLGSSKGSCWDTKLEKCATQVVKDAKTAARKID